MISRKTYVGTKGVFENIQQLDKNTYRHLTTLSEHLKENQNQNKNLSNRTQRDKVENGHINQRESRKKKNVITCTLALQYNMKISVIMQNPTFE